MVMPSPMIAPADIRGSSELYGSWKMICMRRRRLRSSRPRMVLMGWPSKRTRPRVAFCRCRIARPSVVLPLPLSPTSPRLSPLRMLRETLSTAWSVARLRENRVPELTGNSTLRFSTSMRTGGSGFWVPACAGMTGLVVVMFCWVATIELLVSDVILGRLPCRPPLSFGHFPR